MGRRIGRIIDECAQVAALVTLAAAAAAGQAGDLMSAMELKGDPARGKAAFEPCVICHRRDASGRANLGTPRLSGQHATVIIKQVADIRSGLRLNPPMKEYVDDPKLTPRALADIASHLQALPIEATIGVGPGTALEHGKALYQRDCAACHGPRGEGMAATFHPMLSAQHYVYLLRELGLIRDGGRGNSNPAMVGVVKGYAQHDFEAVADYLSRLPPPGR